MTWATVMSLVFATVLSEDTAATDLSEFSVSKEGTAFDLAVRVPSRYGQSD